ncbi:MAG: ATP-binding protein [Firmicutes bacterium]|nr:ATP-binding protein [Bacillota bacterium]
MKIFNRLTIAQKLMFSYVVILVISLGIVILAIFNSNRSDELQTYLYESVVERYKFMMEFHQLFTDMQRVMITILWERDLLGEEDANVRLQQMDNLYIRMHMTINSYIQTLNVDERLSYEELTARVRVTRSYMDTVTEVYEHFLLSFEGGETEFNMEHILALGDAVNMQVSQMLTISRINIDNVRGELHQSIVGLQMIFLIVSIMILSLIIGIAVSMLKHFKFTRMSSISENAKKVQMGDFDVNLRTDDDDEIGLLSNTIADMIDVFQLLLLEINDTAQEFSLGDTDARLDEEMFVGTYRYTAVVINSIIENMDNDISEILSVVEKYGNGDFDALLKPMPGKKESANITLNLLQNNFRNIYIDIENLAQSASKGDFNKRISVDRYSGDWKNAIVMLNNFVASVVQPVNEIAYALKRMSQGDLDVKVSDNLDALSDIKAVYQKARSLETAHEENLAKNQFLAHMSHEIRTPVNVIRGVSDIQLLKKHSSPEVEEAFLQIHKSSTLLIGIIDDLLDLSKIAAGKLTIVEEPYETSSFIMDTIQYNIMLKGSKDIKFIVDIDETIPSELIGDQLRIKQVLNNLLSNAFKYTPGGQIKLTMKRESTDLDNFIILHCTVADTGQGMTKEQASTLFNEQYVRFNQEENRYIQGTGIGMHITSRLAKLMDGEISVETEKGKGSTFTVSFPQEIHDATILGKETVDKLATYDFDNFKVYKNANFVFEPMPYGKVLVVDDQDSNLYVARGILSHYGMQVETVTSGAAAIERVSKGNVYDIIFMDHMMPEMDGLETAKRIQALGYEHPLVALTANTILGQSDLFMSNGFAGFVSKPIDIMALNVYLMRLIYEKQPPEVVEKARAEWQNKKAETLKVDNLVDDEGLKKIFVGDAKKTLKIISEILAEGFGNFGDEKFEKTVDNFAIAVHGIKSSLANIGENELSNKAYNLEKLANENNILEISENVNGFIAELQAKVNLLDNVENAENSANLSETDINFLQDKLSEIQTLAKKYNKKGVKAILSTLEENNYPQKIKVHLDEIASLTLRGDFNGIAKYVGTVELTS